jgi:hypothetical protein
MIPRHPNGAIDWAVLEGILIGALLLLIVAIAIAATA